MRIRTEPAGRGGWSRWVQPIMRGYLFKCCDCGLVHEMQFNALEQVTTPTKRGTWKAKKLPHARVEFRARRKKTS